MIFKKFDAFITRISSLKTMFLFLGFYMLFNAVILPNSESEINRLAHKEIGVVDLTFGYNPDRTVQMINGYGPESAAYYINSEMFTDAIYPVIYAFFYGIILSLLYKKKELLWIRMLPFIAMIFDFLENISIIYLLENTPIIISKTVHLCEIFKLLKWSIFGLIIILILIALLRLLKNKLVKTSVSARN
ncbi:MAG: hypothetical protein GQ574_17985 [Crocinitomix sp.]|nr:hypothetical protein [Crocinitomix sp.]